MPSRRSLTVGDLVRIPSLQLSVLAGAAGLNREIHFVHISELESPERWLEGGELLITTGLGVPQDEARQNDYVRALAEKKVAALAVGIRVANLHASTVALADDMSFPIVHVPKDVPFLAITRQVVEATFGASEQLFATQLAILETLRVRTERDSPSWDLLQELESITGYKLDIVTPAGLAPHTGERVVERSSLPTGSIQGHDHGFLLNGYAIPVRVGDRLAGFVVARERDGIAGGGIASVRHIATLAGVEMSSLYRERIQRREVGARLFAKLAAGSMPPEQALVRLHEFGLRGQQGYVVCAIAGAGRDGFEELDHRLWDEGVPHLLMQEGQFLALLPNQENALAVVQGFAGALVGASEPIELPGSLGVAKSQAVWALMSPGPRAGTGIIRFSDGGTFWLPNDPNTLERVVSRILGPIEDYDAQNGTDLLHSLDTYFKHDAQVAKAASTLFVHSHTLAYRLRRIEEITGRRLKRLVDQTELWIALQAYPIVRGGQAP